MKEASCAICGEEHDYCELYCALSHRGANSNCKGHHEALVCEKHTNPCDLCNKSNEERELEEEPCEKWYKWRESVDAAVKNKTKST